LGQASAVPVAAFDPGGIGKPIVLRDHVELLVIPVIFFGNDRNRMATPIRCQKTLWAEGPSRIWRHHDPDLTPDAEMRK
jgi:hypothetical protein